MRKTAIIMLLALTLVFMPNKASAQVTNKLYYGCSGSQVAEIQQDLKILGYYTGGIDGKYGYGTYTAVKNFQSNYNLSSTGALDFKTLNEINKLLSGEPHFTKLWNRDERVRELQTYLHALGYLSVEPTGYFGSLTLNALNKLQRDYGYQTTSYANDAVFSQIFSVIDIIYAPKTVYNTYQVVQGDTIWSVSQKFNTTMDKIKSANGLTQEYLTIGQVIKIPHTITPVKPTFGKYGEYLDWFASAQFVFPIGANARVIDFFSGKSFNIRRTIGAGHADCEPLTSQDTAMMKEIFSGKWSWEMRPIILVVNGRYLAASMAGMPHAGLDAYPADANVDNRSDNYGYGPNFDYIKRNNMDGHFDIHFPGSLRHKDWQIDATHQEMIKISSNR